MTQTRVEKDSLGEVEVPSGALYGAQTQRALNHFQISGQQLPERFILALLQIKAAASRANGSLGLIAEAKSDAIVRAAEQCLADPGLMNHFPVDVFQTGSGTSTNMNANEVLARLASQSLGAGVHPNDDVNCCQSSNDVIPTAIHVSCVMGLQETLLPALRHLSESIRQKGTALRDQIKTGRTHLMDAMPVRFDQILDGWATQIDQNATGLEYHQGRLQSVALGGTAVGTGVNAHPEFAAICLKHLSEALSVTWRPAPSYFAHMGSQDIVVGFSGQMKTTAVSLMKIANDLRWMNSGPLAGLGEITLQALQPGSSIMPGKVNPVIPEAVAMVAAQVIGNDTTITVAGQSGNFELNVMLPVIARNVLESIELLGNASRILADKAVTTFGVNADNVQKPLSMNPILVTALNPLIGYSKAAEIAKKAYQSGRPVIDVAEEETTLSRMELEELLDPKKMTQ